MAFAILIVVGQNKLLALRPFHCNIDKMTGNADV